MAAVSKITPCLWFDDQAEAAAEFYVGVFPDSRIVTTTRFGEAGKELHQKPVGSVMTVEFELAGQSFTALNGGPMFQFSEAISLQVGCDSQDEVDHYWEKLSAGGDPQAQQCGWLKDQFGVSWQVVPNEFIEMVQDADQQKVQRAMLAMFQMKKLDIAALRKAFDG